MQNIRKNIIGVAALGFALVSSGKAEAGACEMNEKAIARVIAASPLPMDVLLLSSLNRLGFGPNADSNLTPGLIRRIEQKEGREAAANVIALAITKNFARATAVDSATMDEVGAMYPGTFEAGYRGNSSAVWNRFLAIGKEEGNEKQNSYRSSLVRAAGARKFLAALRGVNYNVGEVLGEFWFNHFSLANQYFTQMDYDLKIRSNICGSFYEMLLDTARHPAMVFFLDNAANKAGAVNENYGREVIELHTLGTGPVRGYNEDGSPQFAYTQAEVYEAARILTGWGAVQSSSGNVGYVFSPAKHDNGVKNFSVLFSRTYKGAGEAEGESFLLDLVQHTLTKRNICRKLGTSLLGRGPSHDMIVACVNAYGDKGNLTAMYRAYLESPEFWGETMTLRGFKTPFELMVSGLRAMGMADRLHLSDLPDVSNADFYASFVYGGLNRFGQRLFRMPDPTGYPIGIKAWASSAYVNNSMSLSFNSIPLVDIEFKEKHGLALERDIRAQNADAQATFDFVTEKVVPLFPTIKGTSIEKSIVRALAANKADESRDAKREPLPLRTVVTQIISSSEFMKK